MILTRLSGEVSIPEIEQWEKSLFDVLEKISDNEVFKIFINLFGFKAINVEAHKRYRSTIPLVLSKYGCMLDIWICLKKLTTLNYQLLEAFDVWVLHIFIRMLLKLKNTRSYMLIAVNSTLLIRTKAMPRLKNYL